MKLFHLPATSTQNKRHFRSNFRSILIPKNVNIICFRNNCFLNVNTLKFRKKSNFSCYITNCSINRLFSSIVRDRSISRLFEQFANPIFFVKSEKIHRLEKKEKPVEKYTVSEFLQAPERPGASANFLFSRPTALPLGC